MLHGLTIYSGFADESTINFGDSNGTGSTSRIGRVTYDHDGNKMFFTVNDAERTKNYRCGPSWNRDNIS